MDDVDTAPATTTARPVPRALRWAGVTLLAAAVVLIAVAIASRKEPAVPPGTPGWLRWYAAVPVALLAGIGLAAWRARSAERPRGGVFRLCCGLLAASATVPAVWAFRLSVDNVEGGLPVLAPFVWLTGCAAGVLGAGLLAAVGLATAGGRGTPRPPAWRPRAVGAVGAAIVVGVPVAVAAVVVDSVTLDASTASAVEPAPVPSEPRARAWDWQPPEGQHVHEVVAAGAGVVVRVDDGVIALDGASGQERWHYRRAGAAAVRVHATPDRSLVTVGFRSSAEGAVGTRVVTLDAMTGHETGFDELLEYGDLSEHLPLGVTDSVMVGAESDRFEFELEVYRGGVGRLAGFDLRTGEPLWEYTRPDECRAGREVDHPVAAADVVVVGMVCAPNDPRASVATAVLVGLDDRTGAERWRLERRIPSRTGEALGEPLDLGWNISLYLESSIDGTTLDFFWVDSTTGDEWTNEITHQLVDTATGAVLLDDEAFPAGDPEQFNRQWLVTRAPDNPGSGEAAAYVITGLDDRTSRAPRSPGTAGQPAGFTGEAMLAFDLDAETERASLRIVPWDGRPDHRIAVDLGPWTSDDPDFRLVPAPGAIVAWYDHHHDTGTDRIIGLA